MHICGKHYFRNIPESVQKKDWMINCIAFKYEGCGTDRYGSRCGRRRGPCRRSVGPAHRRPHTPDPGCWLGLWVIVWDTQVMESTQPTTTQTVACLGPTTPPPSDAVLGPTQPPWGRQSGLVSDGSASLPIPRPNHQPNNHHKPNRQSWAKFPPNQHDMPIQPNLHQHPRRSSWIKTGDGPGLPAKPTTI